MSPALAVVAALVLALVLAPTANRARLRARLRRPGYARRADRVADRGVPILLTLAAAFLAVAFVPGLPGSEGGGVRLIPLGAALGLLTGVPFAAERRSLRARLAGAPPPADPLAGIDLDAGHPEVAARLCAGDARAALEALGPLDPATATLADLRLRALAAASLGDARTARACALRCVQLAPEAQDLPTRTGLLLCRAGRFREGIRLLDRGAELAPEAAGPRAALVEGLRLAGRLREAVAAFEDPAPGGPTGAPGRTGRAGRSAHAGEGDAGAEEEQTRPGQPDAEAQVSPADRIPPR